MTTEILVNITPRESRVVFLENKILHEIYIERNAELSIVGNIYKGKVTRLLPGIAAAFVDIGLERAGFLHGSDLLTPDTKVYVGQEVLVQIYKDPLGSKGARLTMQLGLPGRHLVMTPFNSNIAISQKITDPVERERLLTTVLPLKNSGYIIRTAANNANTAEIIADQNFLQSLWQSVVTQVKSVSCGSVVFTELPLYLRILRDCVSDRISQVRVDNLSAWQQMQDYAKNYLKHFAAQIFLYTDNLPIFDLNKIDEHIQKALERKVPLPSGGHLVFDQTEAMTTIDVNTGSYLGLSVLAHTIIKTNLEAAAAIAHQVKLRNLGGIIIIDFIDMTELSHHEELLTQLKNHLAHDPIRTEVSELSSLGLIQMTRKRTRESLEHVLCILCPTCQGRRSIKSIASICYEIVREVERTAHYYDWPGFLIIAADKVIAALTQDESQLIKDLKTKFAKPILLQTEKAYGQEHFALLPLPTKGEN
jgi:ribonuclease G